MGRQESLTAWALGRTPYENEPVEPEVSEAGGSSQQYDQHGHPRNPETRRRERENIRAANEVMQVTGVVEDAIAAKKEARQYMSEKNKETFRGLRFLEAGRAVLVGGVWGVIGFRRRVLLYSSYSDMSFVELLCHQTTVRSVPGLLFAGIPTVVAYHVSDWVSFLTETCIDGLFDEDEEDYTSRQLWLKHTAQRILDLGFYYITLHLRMFAILQQLDLIPSSQILPSLRSFVPFSPTSPLQLPPPPPSLNVASVLSWSLALTRSMTPVLAILLHGKIKFAVSRLLYRPIYKALPRPTGESMFVGLPIHPPLMEYDTPDTDPPAGTRSRSEDEPTLRALEGRPALDLSEPEIIQDDTTAMEGEEEEIEVNHARMISFDVEATTPVEGGTGSWSAELRSANEPKQTGPRFRVTGLTILPTILATEGLKELVGSILVLPLEQTMVRIIGRAYRQSGHLDMSDLYEIRAGFPSIGNLFAAYAVQLIFTGALWAGFTRGIQWMTAREKKAKAKSKGSHENRTNPRERPS